MACDGRREQQPREAKLTAIASFLNRDVTGITLLPLAHLPFQEPSALCGE